MRAWAEVDLGALKNNCRIVCRSVGGDVGLIAVVKSNAYGHGIKEVTKALDEAGAEMFAVISLEEARQAREVSRKPILIMGHLESKEIAEAVEEGYTLSLYDREMCSLIQRTAERLNRRAKVHVKADTGLNRLGMSVEDTVSLLLGRHHFPHIHIEAVFSHLIDARDVARNGEQLRLIQEIILQTQDRMEVLPFHLVSSKALKVFTEGYLDAVRVGLVFYGTEETLPGIKPVTSYKGRVMQVRRVEQGQGVGYGHDFVASRESDIAILSFGYADGLPTRSVAKPQVLIGGNLVPLVGRIMMNHCAADVTHLRAKRGDEVVLAGSQSRPGDEAKTLTIQDLADWSALSHHELVTRLGLSMSKIYYGG